LAVALVAAALAVGVGLVVVGASWPSLCLMVVFALLSWFAVNRYTFFPSELAVTSESAVLLAAVVVFRDDAPFLGPWCVAALVGPVDAVHWEHRAFSRMGFNAAHQMLAVVVSAAAYAGVAAMGGDVMADDVMVDVLALAAAVVAYAAVVWIAGVVVLHVWSRLAVVGALPQLLALDWIVVPLGVLGALAGLAASRHGWWALPLVLVPVAFVPELVLAHGRSIVAALDASRRLRVLAVAAAAAVLLGCVGVAVVGSVAVVGAGVLVLACGAAAELRMRRRALVPPLVGVVVVVAAAVWPGSRDAVSWSSPARAVGALGAGLLVAAAASLTAPPGARRFELARTGWALPLFAVGVAAALAVPRFGPAAITVPVLLLPSVGALLAAWGSPPWSSALLVPGIGSSRVAFRRIVLLTLVAIGSTAAAIAARSSTHAPRAAIGLVALVALEVALAAAGVGARQWRLDPRRRRVAAVVVGGTAAALLAVLPLLTRSAAAWVLPIGAAGGVLALLVGDGPARLGDVAARSADDGDEPG
jgi:hypothetical protein